MICKDVTEKTHDLILRRIAERSTLPVSVDKFSLKPLFMSQVRSPGVPPNPASPCAYVLSVDDQEAHDLLTIIKVLDEQAMVMVNVLPKEGQEGYCFKGVIDQDYDNAFKIYKIVTC